MSVKVERQELRIGLLNLLVVVEIPASIQEMQNPAHFQIPIADVLPEPTA